MGGWRAGVAGWIARVLGILYVALLWWAWWQESQARREPRMGEDTAAGSWFEQWAVLTHLLPAIVLLVVLVLAWRWPVVGAIGFLAYAVITVVSWFPEWVYAGLVTGPPLVIGILFLVEALVQRRRTGTVQHAAS
ncbi:hypothetical protein ACFPER_16860 [Agromyces aurantiacus]|uniref:DUF7670 domain-containing protein n=1 Tax=Agromyces aurantiacus TaxID=165814 RepID=A0ABV9R9R2_9MICO|nr:hypothetical protein [Agromyces aurantiacus]MBM7504638.1 hypothetical protein [Agromyces aurantiacus]